ncbi:MULTISPECIES: Flp pilus assembly protein CpaB [unclassified Aureimonas]|uniref:Flp pilus assembly protein CpaB n=1 Tax=unclassified Aureimonas TaxID=2615206 RepID=UPI0006FADFB7|nr:MULTISPECIES: Flp pilus assembly protein CpaB [unclassified Aureimonas]KQT53860.1 Flp pilus assembly protein CpaB [Aureimonas sp. Leaf427]KQT71699.1 Flp pilus assembly protein CpaB [Aureimonas sp. Leaf460]
MKIARLAVLGVAVLAAGGAALVASNLSAPDAADPVIITAAPAEPPIKLTEVLVANKDLPMGTSVTDGLDWQKWPQDGVSGTFIQKNQRPNAVEELKGSVARQTFFAGEPIREDKLIKTDRGFMSAILPAGMRAIAVQITADTSAGGFILPNDHVDVIMTRRRDGTASGSEKAGFETETVLSNLRVLAIDQTIEEQNGTKVVVGSTATLEVDAEQAEALTAAQQMAERLVLSLRSLADSVPGSPGYAQFLLQDEQRPGKIRIVRYGQTTDITPKK